MLRAPAAVNTTHSALGSRGQALTVGKLQPQPVVTADAGALRSMCCRVQHAACSTPQGSSQHPRNVDECCSLAVLLQAAAEAGSIPPALAQLRSLVAAQLQAPAELQQEAAAKAEGAGLITSGEWGAGSSTWETAWGAICKVRRPLMLCGRQQFGFPENCRPLPFLRGSYLQGATLDALYGRLQWGLIG